MLIMAFVLIANGEIYDEINHVEDSTEIEDGIKKSDLSKRWTRKSYCTFSKEAKESRFIEFLNEVSRFLAKL